MFDYINISKCRLIHPDNEFNRTKRFEHTPEGTVYSDDFRPIADSFFTYTGDAMISAGVTMSDAPSFTDVSLNSLDGVEEQSLRILESEDFIIKDEHDKK